MSLLTTRPPPGAKATLIEYELISYISIQVREFQWMSFSVHHWQKRYELVRRGSGSRACLPLNRNRLSQRPQWRILLVLLTCLDVLNATFIGFRVPLRELERISLWRMSMQIISYQMFLEYLRSRLLPTYLPIYAAHYLLIIVIIIGGGGPNTETRINNWNSTNATQIRSSAAVESIKPICPVFNILFITLLHD